MYVKKDQNEKAALHELNQEDLEIIMTAILRMLHDIPLEKQPRYRRLAMDIDKLIKL